MSLVRNIRESRTKSPQVQSSKERRESEEDRVNVPPQIASKLVAAKSSQRVKTDVAEAKKLNRSAITQQSAVNLREQINTFSQNLLTVSNKSIFNKNSLASPPINLITKTIPRHAHSKKNIFFDAVPAQQQQQQSDKQPILLNEKLSSLRSPKLQKLLLIQTNPQQLGTQEKSTLSAQTSPLKRPNPITLPRIDGGDISSRNNNTMNKSLVQLHGKSPSAAMPTQLAGSKTTRESTMELIQQKLNEYKVKSDSDYDINNNNQKHATEGMTLDERIAESVNELRKLRRKRKIQMKLKKLEQMSQKYQDILTKKNADDNQTTNVKNNDQMQQQRQQESQLSVGVSDTLSLTASSAFTSDESLLKRIDEISLTDDTSEIGELAKLHDLFDEHANISSSSNNVQNQQKTETAGDESNNSKHTKSKISNLESIMEEHSDYFNHIAGKCACGEFQCGGCVKCKGRLSKPAALDVKWESSYARSYNSSSTFSRTHSDINDLKFHPRLMYRQEPISAQDYSSMFKNDYKIPVDPDFKKVTFESRIPPRPLYSLSSYKVNYLDWQANPSVRGNIVKHEHQIVKGMPLVGSSQMKQDYCDFPGYQKVKLAKPSDQVPLPRYSILYADLTPGQAVQNNNGDNNNKKSTEKNGDRLEELGITPNKSKNKKKYELTPGYEGQYETTTKKAYQVKEIESPSKKLLHEKYLKKIEKYKQKIKQELLELEAK